MGRKPRQIAAADFKARCLSLLDQVAEQGDVLVVTKRGVPVAKVVPVESRWSSSLKGSVLHQGDLVSPLGEEWNASR